MSVHREFWKSCPALLAGVSLLIGIGVFLLQYSLWILLLWSLYIVTLRRWSLLLFTYLGGAYALLLFPTPSVETPTNLRARLCISSLQKQQTPFHERLMYRGTLYFEGAALPCTVATPSSKHRPIASSDYFVRGTLIERGPFDYVLKPTEWTPIRKSWSLAELRFRAKEKIRAFLQSKFHTPRTAELLTALVTGDMEDRQLRYEFGRLGLQHLLAISGFHFGVLLFFLSALLNRLFSTKYKWALMLLVTTAYFLFVGSSPAVQRAWLATTLFLIGKLWKKRVDPFNLLGGAMLLELLWNPLSAMNIGFQLSFGSCFGILLFYRIFEQRLRALFPARSVQGAASLPLFAQCAYLLSSSLRASIAITLAVNAAILPLLLFHFGRFPYLGLLYNLFIPLFISILLFGLFAAILAHLALGILGTPLFSCLDWYCSQIVELVRYPPLCLDHLLFIPEFPASVLSLYLFALLVLRLGWPAAMKIPHLTK